MTDLELLLRPHCQRLRVVHKLSGGAHLLIPSDDASNFSSLAIRVYYECDLSNELKSTTATTTVIGNNKDIAPWEETVGLRKFLETFQSAVCLFVIQSDQQRQELLDDPTSVFHRAQRVVRSIVIGNDKKNQVGLEHCGNKSVLAVNLVGANLTLSQFHLLLQ